MIWYRIVINSLMIVLGIVILARALPLGAGFTGLLVGGGLIGLGAYRVNVLVRRVRREG
jgi:hypothetical protein